MHTAKEYSNILRSWHTALSKSDYATVPSVQDTLLGLDLLANETKKMHDVNALDFITSPDHFPICYTCFCLLDLLDDDQKKDLIPSNIGDQLRENFDEQALVKRLNDNVATALKKDPFAASMEWMINYWDAKETVEWLRPNNGEFDPTTVTGWEPTPSEFEEESPSKKIIPPYHANGVYDNSNLPGIFRALHEHLRQSALYDDRFKQCRRAIDDLLAISNYHSGDGEEQGESDILQRIYSPSVRNTLYMAYLMLNFPRREDADTVSEFKIPQLPDYPRNSTDDFFKAYVIFGEKAAITIDVKKELLTAAKKYAHVVDSDTFKEIQKAPEVKSDHPDRRS